MKKVYWLEVDDWSGIYVDGHLKREGDRIEEMELLNLAEKFCPQV